MNSDVDINSYEFQERMAILELNNPTWHRRHAFHKAKKEIVARNEYDRIKQRDIKK